MNTDWIQSATSRYDNCIRDTLHWMLDREPLGSGLLNTKVDPLTGVDYDITSGLRGPDFTYGWIQGRGLEALVAFANHYRAIDPQLFARLDQAARTLYDTLAELHARDSHAYFLYDKTMRPIRQGNNGLEQQTTASSIFTYSDAFVAKGLFAASCQFDPDRSGQYLAYILDVVAAIEDDRFQMNETQELTAAHARAEANDYGPRMILLGASGLLIDNNQSNDAVFANRFIDDVLEHYFDPDSGLLLNVPGQDSCNVGHAIELCGFAFEYLQQQPDDSRIATLISILKSSLKTGMQGPGIALSLSVTSGKAVSPYYPWWPMPEAIRACALALTLTGDKTILPLWQQADDVFFSNFWRGSQRFAYQTRTDEGPSDFVPATPDLDPGYHTGLSMLSAIKSIERRLSSQ